MTLRLHAVPDWASLAVRMVLEDAGIGHEIRWIRADQEEHRGEAFRRVNPLGLIPALETDDGPVFETGAVLLWIADRHPGLAPAPGDADRGAFLSWFFFVANTVHPTVMRLIHPERSAGPEAAPAVLATADADLRRHLAQLEAVAAAAPWWLSTERPSILVPYLLTLMRWAAGEAPDPAHNVPIAAFPRLQAIGRWFEARPAAVRLAADERLGPTPFSAPRRP
jgi:glutathione S-transferase